MGFEPHIREISDQHSMPSKDERPTNMDRTQDVSKKAPAPKTGAEDLNEAAIKFQTAAKIMLECSDFAHHPRRRRELLSRRREVAANASGATPLHEAALAGDSERIKELLKLGASVHAVDRESCTPMHYAARCEVSDNGRAACLQLVKASAKVDVKNRAGETPVLSALTRGDLRMMDVLLHWNWKDDPNYTTSSGSTPLITACQNMDTMAVRKLLKAGADANQPGQGVMPLELAAGAGRLELVQELLRGGAKPNLGPLPPLVAAAAAGHAATVQELLRAAADANIASANGLTAMSAASQRGHVDVVHELILHGVELAQPTGSGQQAAKPGGRRACPGGLQFCLRPARLPVES
eukprot:gnl/TRDRNA2_/TRDRNA2_187153_c0_seq1.p1 gnl/TRDRNA2_/TRDRNA2_187153_c0~~gnl/TRDRNA2_/TRDRNA2_187153_c0_seq1.p1  ORF type:complete len:352 (+),score=57.65 gnl/TRDRNA2_/TRDRNA2_187153_c0_seq1:119-1174(+)